MEGTEEASRVAAATRELAAKRARVSTSEEVGTKRAKAAPVSRNKACTHIVALPKDFDTDTVELDPGVYGTLQAPSFDASRYKKQYPFDLDPFQSVSVACVERNESVMVAAHTSAGKTAVAEYAIAKALAAKQRVMYTSPLKALSNQKYRELQEEFEDVGLMTGDVTIDTDASCVVMTTEILRAMLYRDSNVMRQVACVIFDEIHYMQDRERGVVWEEAIISMPSNVTMLFLSATLSNAREFAEWVASLHGKPCHVVYTEYRPTPLEHFGLPCVKAKTKGQEQKSAGLYKVLSKDGTFSTRLWEDLSAAGVIKAPWSNGSAGDEEAGEAGHTRGAAAGAENGGAAKHGAATARPEEVKGLGMSKQKRDVAGIADKIVDVLRLAQNKGLYPTIVFSFIRLECETFAATVYKWGEKNGELDFTTAEEKEAIETVFQNATAALKEDAELPAVQNVKRFLLKGIGVHHGGLIPLVKELVEILFQESLVKVLFATETFAMGLNMPARSVVFTSHIKNDGTRFRPLTSGEYIQMSGRAGRRGKDDRGYCIMMIEDPDVYSPAVAKSMMQGKAMPLVSRFKLSYYTLLNMLRKRESGIDEMGALISHSFQQFQHEQAVPAWQSRLSDIERQLANPKTSGLSQEACEAYVRLKDELGQQQATVQAALCRPDACLPFLTTGRLVRVREGSVDWGWGIVLATYFRPGAELDRAAPPSAEELAALKQATENWQVVVLLPVRQSSLPAGSAPAAPEPVPANESDAALVPVPVQLGLVVDISKHRVGLPADVRPVATRASILRDLKEFLYTRCDGPGGVPTLHPIDDMEIADAGVRAALPRIRVLEGELSGNPIYKAEIAGDTSDAMAQFRKLAIERQQLQRNIARSELGEFREQVDMRKRVLRRLEHITDDGVLTAKGKAAAEIDAGDELMTTELMFNAVWKNLDTPQLVALLSCLVPCNEKTEKGSDAVRLPLELASAVSTLQEFAGIISDVSNECGIEVDKEMYTLGFTPTLMVPLYQWARGASFASIMANTMIFEGTLIRCTRRLVELMTQITRAAENVGETEMQAQVQKAMDVLQRGIMFCGSLYL